VCGDIATQIASYNMVDATLGEKYGTMLVLVVL
jgi:hypothetical protein